MRNWIWVAALSIVGLSACHTQSAVQEQQELQRPNLSLKDVVPPMKAGPKVKAQQEKFRRESAEKFKSRQLGSQYYVLQAQRTFNEDKLDSASLFFNRAWLLDSTNNDVYWGYGLLYGRQDAHDKALYTLYHALSHDNENPRLLTDVATAHLASYYSHKHPNDLHQSRKLLLQALKLKPQDPSDTYYKLALNSYYLGEYAEAWDYLHLSVRQDGTKENEKFIAALLQKVPDPQGVYVQ